MIREIYREIAERLRAENELLPKSRRVPLRVCGKLFTPKNGTFLVQLVPEDPTEGVLTLLFRFKDLYFESYHFDGKLLLVFQHMYNTLLLVLSSNPNVICFAGVWYRLRDFNAELPPQEQLPYTRVVVLTRISSRYVDLGGYPRLGHPAFDNCYKILSATAELYTTEHGLYILKSGPLSVPPAGISEAIRFRIHERWMKGVLRGGIDVRIPNTISMYFTEWGDLSTSMYTKVLPQECILRLVDVYSRMGVLKRRDMAEGNQKAVKRFVFLCNKAYFPFLFPLVHRIHLSVYAISKFLSAPKSGRGDEEPPAVVFGWHKEDNKRLLRASISVHKMEDTIRFVAIPSELFATSKYVFFVCVIILLCFL